MLKPIKAFYWWTLSALLSIDWPIFIYIRPIDIYRWWHANGPMCHMQWLVSHSMCASTKKFLTSRKLQWNCSKCSYWLVIFVYFLHSVFIYRLNTFLQDFQAAQLHYYYITALIIIIIVLVASDIRSCLTGQLSMCLVVQPGSSPSPGCPTVQLSNTRLPNWAALLASGCLTGQLSNARLPNWTAPLASGCVTGQFSNARLPNWAALLASGCLTGQLSSRPVA